MSDHPEDGPPNESSSNAFEKNRRGNDGMQRRDLLLGGSSLAAMTALAATAPATAQVQQAAPAPAAAPASTGPKLGEILPFPQPPRPVITEPDWQGAAAEASLDPAAEGRPQHPGHSSRPNFLCGPIDLRRTDQLPDHGSSRQRGADLHELSRQQSVFAEPHRAIDRTQSTSKLPSRCS